MNEVEKKGIGKSQVGLMVAVVIITILAVSSVWLYLRVDSLETEVSNLQLNKYSLQTEIGYLTSEKEDLQDEIDSLNQQYDYYVAYHQYSNWEYDEAQIFFYYVLPEEQWFGVYDLEIDLEGEWIDPYERGVFDCSEMSAYLEWELENLGWHTMIVVGDAPFGSGYHAWLLVETIEGAYMPVEATTAEIIWWDDPYFDNYFEYDYSFETIQDTFEYFDETEFDWWN